MGNRFGKKILKSGPRSGLRRSFLPAAIVCLLAFCSADFAYGHGGSSEIFPPVDLDGKRVTLEASSSQNDPDTKDDRQISISFLDFDSKVTLRDVTFHIRAEHGSQFLFEKEFMADNGFLVFNFVSEDTDSVTMEEEAGEDIFGSLLGLDSRKIHVKGPKLSDGGLYRFDVSVLTAGGYSKILDDPLLYNVGISIPQTVRHEVNHPDYGPQAIETITYYDELSDFNYDINSKEISFSMPFDWTEDNIELTSVVHQELVIPKTFGELRVSGFSMYVNGIKLSDSIVSIDDYVPEIRTVHFIVNQQELLRVFETNKEEGMNFVIRPSQEKAQLSDVTKNGQFRVLASWEPERLESDSVATVTFDIMDVFLKNRPVAVSYGFVVTQDERIIFQQSGFSTDSKDEHNTAQFMIPHDVGGIIHLNFSNLDGNQRAAASFPVIVDSKVAYQSATSIPDWIKDTAGWWAAGDIDDETFLQGIEFLIQNDIILIPKTSQSASASHEIPDWIKDTAGWWAAGDIDDETFVGGLQFLIQQGILYV